MRESSHVSVELVLEKTEKHLKRSINPTVKISIKQHYSLHPIISNIFFITGGNYLVR